MRTPFCEQDHTAQPSRTCQAHLRIYENLAYVGDRPLDKALISIGRNPQADVVLNHDSVADIHALVKVEAGQAYLTNRYPENGLRLNGRPVDLQWLKHEDVIDIGPFSLKVRMDEVETRQTTEKPVTYAVRLINRYPSAAAMQEACGRLAKMLRTDPAKVLPLIRQAHCIIKKNLDGLAANRWQSALLNSQIICDVQIEKPLSPPPPVGRLIRPVLAVKSAPVVSMEAPQAVWSEPHHDPLSIMLEDAPDEDEEIWEAPFSLRDKLSNDLTPAPDAAPLPRRLQVIKTMGDSVVDVGILGKGKKYQYDTHNGRHCLVHHHRRHGARVYLTDRQSGYVENSRGETIADLNSYKTDAYQHKKNKSLFCIPLPADGTIVVMANGCRYQIFEAPSRPSPKVMVAPAAGSFTWRHWAGSAGVHLFFILCISVSMLLQAGAPNTQAPHFVKINPEMLKPLKAVKTPQPPKKTTPPVKPEPRKATEKAKLSKSKPKPVAQSSKRKRTNQPVAKASPARKASTGRRWLWRGQYQKPRYQSDRHLECPGGRPFRQHHGVHCSGNQSGCSDCSGCQ